MASLFVCFYLYYFNNNDNEFDYNFVTDTRCATWRPTTVLFLDYDVADFCSYVFLHDQTSAEETERDCQI